jgi:tRNA pseudouridine38-40 synthase
MALYKTILAYDGTDFSGFQRQANVRTVQQEVENALTRVGWQGKSILASGRTDAGVHATGQVITFEMDWTHPVGDLQNAMNANLPKDIAVRSLEHCKTHFHPRFDAVARRYRYQIRYDPVRNPVEERYVWRILRSVEPAKMQAAVPLLLGTHDFRLFGHSPVVGGVTIRNLFDLQLHFDGSRLDIVVEANAFLYHMVRRIVRLLVDVGQNRMTLAQVQAYIDCTAPEMVQGLAPPQGLFLTNIRY